MSVWEELYRRFDPARPGEARWRARRPNSPAARIQKLLDLPVGEHRILLTGTVGTGKTTELLRVAESRADKEFVVFLDLVRHFDEVVGERQALENVSSWEVCFLAGLALVRAADEKLRYQWPEGLLSDLGNAWKSLSAATGTPPPPQVDIPTLAKSVMVLASTAAHPVAGTATAAGLELLSSAAGAVRWSLPFGLSQKSLPDQSDEMKTLLACVNQLLAELQRRHRRVLIIIDGLDRVRDLNHARRLFVDSDMLGRLACPLIVCGPFALRHHPLLFNVPQFKAITLVNEPVLDQHDPARPGAGIAFMCEVFRARVRDLETSELIPEDALKRLAYYSGGRARDFVLSIRGLAEEVLLSSATAATADMVERVITERRLSIENGLNKAHIAVLQEVADDPRHQLPGSELALELLAMNRLLPYPDGSEWYYPHPLLTLNLIRPNLPGPTGSNDSSS